MFGGPSIDELEKIGITAIIDLNQDPAEKNAASKNKIKYIGDSRLKIADDYQPIPIEKLKYTTNIIHELISHGHYVYLHCSACHGRSPTVAAAYLICLGTEKKTAMSTVKSVRKEAWNNDDKNYAASLDEFEKAHRGNCRG